MTRLQTILLLTIILLVGLIPITIYLMEGNSLTGDIASLPTRETPRHEQAAQALAGLVVKPTYMMLCLAVIIALIGQTRPALAALLWGQIAFLAGETFCAINFYVYRHESLISEYLHSFGMALAFGLTLLALIEWVELLTNARRKPLFLKEIRAFTLFALPIFAMLTFIPLLAPLQTDAYTTSIFNVAYSYTRFEAYELYERRSVRWDDGKPQPAVCGYYEQLDQQSKRASTIASARARLHSASWNLFEGMAMKLRASSSSIRCCGVGLKSFSVSRPSKK